MKCWIQFHNMIDAFVVVQILSKRVDMQLLRTENGLHHALSSRKENAAAKIFIRFGWTTQKLCNCLEKSPSYRHLQIRKARKKDDVELLLWIQYKIICRTALRGIRVTIGWRIAFGRVMNFSKKNG